MKADSKSLLNDFIAGTQGVQYIIPVYQRNYTWKKKHVLKLVSDIDDLLKCKSSNHFIGSIVYVVTSEIFNQREWSIVDGQQRLTTVFLMLYCIRDILLENNQDQLAKSLTSQYLENVNSEGTYKLRLKPLVSNDQAFKMIVESNFEDIDKNSLIYQNYILLKNEVKKWTTKYTISDILSAINKLYIVYIQLDKSDNAQQIFESINSTGATLKSSDLIRNFIFMNKNDNIQTQYYKNYWTPLEKNLDTDTSKLEEFFRFYLAVKKFDLVNKNDLYEEFVLFWNNCIKSNQYSEEMLLSDILKYSKFYSQIYLSNTIDGAEKEIEILKKIKSNMPAPLLMEIVNLYYDQKIDILQLKASIQLINIYLIRRHMCELDTSSITRLFPSILKSVLTTCNEKYSGIVDVLKYYLVNQTKNKSSYLPNDEEVRDTLSKKNAYVLSHTRTFFDIVEMNSPIAISYKNLTVEHVMPQTSTEYWEKASGVSEEDYSNLVNLMGNLTLADKNTNSKIGNQDFETKKKELEKVGKINLSKEIFESKIWNKDTILRRNEHLIDLFINLFPYFASKNNYEEGNSFPITFTKGFIVAKALLYFNKEVELLADSELRISDNRDSVSETKLKEYLEDGTIIKLDDCYKTTIEIYFPSISATSNFVYGGSNNGWSQWKDDDGNVLDLKIRKMLEKI